MCFTRHEFESLSETHQLALLMECGVDVAKRRDRDFRYILYNVDGLYVEEVRSAFNDAWLDFCCIEDTDELLPYTEDIELPV